MRNKIEQLVDGLAGRELVGDVITLLDDHRRQGDTAFVAEVGAALHARYGSGAQDAEHHYLFARILWDLATAPGHDNVGHALRLGLATRSPSRRPERRAAAVLAANQSPRDLAPVFTPGSGAYDDAPDELRACLVHELVLRGSAPAPEAVDWAANSPYWQGHPLAWLPWTLSPLEDAPQLPRYWQGSAGYGVPYGLPDGPRLPSGPAPVPAVRSSTLRLPLTAAVDRWAKRHNGRVEAGIYATETPLDPAVVHPMLAVLPLDCLAGLAAPESLAIVATTPAEAWRQLFAAASIGGGREDDWWYGAHGRLAAWQSLAALSGAPKGAGPAEVEQRAAACTWYAFRPSTGWFNPGSMNVGFLVLSPGRTRFAVLAATDYDGT